jgi:hypothetical protein
MSVESNRTGNAIHKILVRICGHIPEGEYSVHNIMGCERGPVLEVDVVPKLPYGGRSSGNTTVEDVA